MGALKSAIHELLYPGHDESRRDFLKQSAAAAASSMLPSTAWTSLIASSVSDGLMEAVNCFIQNMEEKDTLIELWLPNSGDVTLLPQSIAATWRAAYENPSLSPQEAQAAMHQAVNQSITRSERELMPHKYLLQHPQDREAFVELVKHHPQAGDYGVETIAEAYVRFNFGVRPDLAITDGVLEQDKNKYNRIANRVLYLRHGIMLPETTQEERRELLQEIQQDFQKNAEKQYWNKSVKIFARKYAQDTDGDGNSIPTYRVHLEPTNDTDTRTLTWQYHQLIASIMTMFPSELMLWDEHEKLIKSPGKLLLTPVDDGLLITLPANWRHTQLTLMQGYLARLERQPTEHALTR